MTDAEQSRDLFTALQPGDKVEITHEVKVGLKVWTTVTRGAVVKTERKRHGLSFRRAADDKVFSDEILLKRDSGELTTVTLDEFTVMKRL
jgi:hypothetical protein